MHAVHVVDASGASQTFVLRRYRRPKHDAAVARREYRTLEVLAERGVPAPRPLLLDDDGRFFARPALALSYVPGRALVSPANVDSWVRGLASAIAVVHDITPKDADLVHLNTFLLDGMRTEVDRGVPSALEDEPLAREVWSTLDRSFSHLTALEPCLVHDDYFPGNVVWNRGRLAAIIDWTSAEVGDRRADVSQCRIDLAFMHSMEAADAFLAAYESATGSVLPDVWFWDLFRGLRASDSFERWLVGYHDLGLTDLTPADLRQRIQVFLRAALKRAR